MGVTGLWPRGCPRPTRSHGEQKVYQAFARQLPAGWAVWHSLRLRSPEGEEGEGDFVVAIPNRGAIVLEVKGGHIELRNGCWLQNNHPLEPSPRSQAHEFARLLRERLRAQIGQSVPYGILTVFPDTRFETPPSQDDLAGLVLGEQDLAWLIEAIEARLDRIFPPNYLVPELDWISAIHRLWGEVWIPRLRLGHRAGLHAGELYRLDQEQIALLDMIGENRRVLVEGEAGSGKTVLARELALRMASHGRRTLLLCFTDALAVWLADLLSPSGVTVKTVRRYAAELLLQQQEIATLPETAEAWEQISLRAACDALAGMTERPEVVLIDEAQDLGDGEWFFVEELSRDLPIWIFADPGQSFWPGRQMPQWAQDFFSFRLPRAYRCPPAILALADALAGRPFDRRLLREGVEDSVIALVSCPSVTSIESKVENEIRKLLSEGFAPGDIAVLSLRGRTTESLVSRPAINSFRIVPADDPQMHDHIVGDTFLRFKGLERPAIIVIDLRLVADQLSLRLHIALTRALDVVRIVEARDALPAELHEISEIFHGG